MIVCRNFCVGNAAKKLCDISAKFKNAFCTEQAIATDFAGHKKIQAAFCGFFVAVLMYKAFDICLDIVRAKVVYFIHLTIRYA